MENEQNNDDVKKMAEETLSLTRENNEMLKKIRRGQKMTQIFRVVYWVIIIGASVGAFYFIQPYIEKFTGAYLKGTANFSSIKNFNTTFSQ